MGRRGRTVTLVLAGLVAGACEPSFDNAHLLDELRVLAVRADPPEAAVGDLVELEALVASPNGGPVDVRLWECAARGGMGQGCEMFSDSTDLGAGTTASFVVPDAWQARLEMARGLPVQLIVTAVARHGEEESRAIKRVVVSSEPTKNTNPTLEALLVDDEEQEVRPLIVAPGASLRLRPIVSEGSVEPYERFRLDGGREPETETLFVSYYYGCGSTSSLKSGGLDDLNARWFAPDEPGRCTVYAILRDDRGGVDFRTREITVR